MKTKLNSRKTSKKKKINKGKFFKNSSIWEELPKIANLKNKPMRLNEDDEIIYS